jgi:hypothetical protein
VTIDLLKTTATCGTFGMLLVGIAATGPPAAKSEAQAPQPGALKVVELREPDGQILSYRHLAASTEVYMRGTRLAPDARVKLKIGSRPGFVELDINRGGITGLKPAHRMGRDYLTYVLWAVSIDGRASNLGEITFEGEAAVPVNLTTPYQTFWLMATAEPNYAVVDPSSRIVLYSVKQGSTSRAIPIGGDMFFYTHYATYDSAPGDVPNGVPNQLLQARKALELASKSANGAGLHAGEAPKEDRYTREALNQAKTFLERAEEAYKQNGRGQEVIQFARTAAQSAENARALAMGVVGGVVARQLQNELITVRGELARLQAADAAASVPAETDGDGTPIPAAAAVPAAPPPVATPLLKQPALWFAAGGWALAIVLLFRRRSG